MSYDIYLEVDAGGPEPVEAFWVNYTSNCAPMWRVAMPDTDGLAGLDGDWASDAQLVLIQGITRMEMNPGTYRAMNPSNGWGDFEGQLAMLRELQAACAKYPKAKIRISR